MKKPLVRREEQIKAVQRAQNHRQLSNALAMILVGTPPYMLILGF
jgi:hypothetical protein